MKKILLLMIMPFSFCIYVAAQHKLKLVWSDEFNYTGLPDSTKWTYEHGYIRNHENQYYTLARKENVFVHDGVLEIKGGKENYANEFYKKGGNDWRTSDSLTRYTSASINTLGKASWKYGRVEVRAKIPKGLGVWPAIWMMGINIPGWVGRFVEK
jgi:beta-glucanase (GH16 family)